MRAMARKLPLNADELPKKLKKNTLAFQREVVDKMSSLATAAFGLVAALAWNSAIQEAFNRLPRGTGIWALVGYAVFVTIVAVIVIIWIGRIAGRLKQAEEEQKAKDAADAAASAPPPA